jgi:iron complex outermembrane receptor protein
LITVPPGRSPLPARRDRAGAERTPADLLGGRLRDDWRRDDGVTRMRPPSAARVWRATSITLSAENLLESQRGEPDGATIIPGRTLVAGVRTAF